MKTNTQSSITGKLVIGYALVVALIATLYLFIDALRTGGGL